MSQQPQLINLNSSQEMDFTTLEMTLLDTQQQLEEAELMVLDFGSDG